MSTNYYWRFAPSPLPREIVTVWGAKLPVQVDWLDPLLHVGKSVAGKFLWASEPERSIAYFTANPTQAVCTSEYGDDMTGADMLKIVSERVTELMHVGTRFS